MSSGAIRGVTNMFGSMANAAHRGVGGIDNNQQSGFKAVCNKSITLDPEPHLIKI